MSCWTPGRRWPPTGRPTPRTCHYGYPQQRALLHDPLDPLLDSLDPLYRRLTAGRSMRDVEHSSAMKITDPYGQVLN